MNASNNAKTDEYGKQSDASVTSRFNKGANKDQSGEDRAGAKSKPDVEQAPKMGNTPNRA